MGDALCGPSNALQNFQKHASQDRTLQQDRLASRPLPTQVCFVFMPSDPAQPSDHSSNFHKAFRTRNPNEGALDREFNSFESTFSGPPLSDVHYQPPPFLQSATPGPAQAHHPQPGVAGWADDFQKLHISDSGMVAPPEQFQQPVHRPSTAHWQQEFSQQHSEQHNQPIQAPTNSIGAAGYRPGMMGMEFAGSGHFSAYHDAPQATQSQGPAAAETFDESAFEAAFAEARAEIELQESRLGHVEEHEASALTPEQTERIGADNIPRSQEGINDADELAKTAGQLLESVKNDTSEKFKQSNFLALMRQLRDREVAVDGDEFRHVSTSP